MTQVTDQYKQLFGKSGTSNGSDIDMSEHGRVGDISTGQPYKHTVIIDPTNGYKAAVTAAGKLEVNASVTATGADGAIIDGVNDTIKATVKDYTNSNPLTVVTVDTNGDYVAGAGGTQYTEGDTDASITGTAAMVEGAANALAVMTQPITDTQIRATPLPISGTVTANLSTTDNDVLDAIEADTTTIAGDTTTIAGDTTSIDAKIPALGQALAAGSVPVVLTAAQLTTLTPPAAITGFALETGGNLAEIKTNTDNIPVVGQALMAASTPVVIASNQSAVPVSFTGSTDVATQTTLAAINAKLVTGTDIGDVTINNASGASAVNIQDGGNTITVDGTVTVGSINAGNNNIGDVDAIQSGTWTVQPGNTQNTTAWLVKEARSTTGTNTSVADSATSVTILASNANRLGATVINDSSAALYLLLGSTAASTTNYSVRIAQYGYFETPFGYTGQLTGIWTSDPGDGAARVTEIT